MVNVVLAVIVAIFIPPIGAAMVAGCGVDVLINICLTLLGYLPGHIHAFYLIWVYSDRRKNPNSGPASGVHSEKCNTGGRGYNAAAAPPPVGIQQGQYVNQNQQVQGAYTK